ncbi:MAG: magnesium/cobalt transporter CorA [Nocardioidaceae bacterium]
MIVDCAVYRDGLRMELADRSPGLEDALAALVKSSTDFIWVGLHEPTNEEMTRVGEALGLHQLAVEDAVRAHQRPKLERYDGGELFMVLKTLWYAEDAVETGEIAIFLGHNFLVTARHGEGAELSVTRRALEQHADLLGNGPFAVLHSVCDRVVDGYEAVAAELQIDVDEIELSVFSESRSDDSKRIYTLKRELAEFRRAVVPLREPLTRFAQGQVAGMPQSAMTFFRDVADHAVRVHEQIETLDNLLSTAHNAYMARISVQQNDDMRKISAWVAIAAVPTMIAGVYGMNFENMPELTWEYGYFLILGVMLGVCTAMYRAFKRSNWL